MSETPPRSERELGTLAFAAIALNGLIGSGVYLLFGPMAQSAGAASIVATVICAAMSLLVALCFAELASVFREDGGAYLYGREAFGRATGFVIGWMSLAESLISFAAVAIGFGTALREVLPALCGAAEKGSSVAIILLLSGLNLAGVRVGAIGVLVLTVLKTAPLVVLALVALPHVQPHVIHDAAYSARHVTGLGEATFLAVFLLSGFEYAAVPAGAAKDPQTAIPRSLVLALLGATTLYVLLQLALFSITPGFVGVAQPLPRLATALFGPWGGRVIALTAAVSMAGFCAGSALVGPRLATALVAGGYVFTGLGARTKSGTPVRAIVLSGLVASALVLLLDFRALVDLGNLALVAQYLPTALAVPRLRRMRPNVERRYQIPGPGWLVPGLAAAASVALLWLSHPQLAEWRATAELLGIGVIIWGASSVRRRTRTTESPPPP